jgi:hypothetical protein
VRLDLQFIVSGSMPEQFQGKAIAQSTNTGSLEKNTITAIHPSVIWRSDIAGD